MRLDYLSIVTVVGIVLVVSVDLGQSQSYNCSTGCYCSLTTIYTLTVQCSLTAAGRNASLPSTARNPALINVNQISATNSYLVAMPNGLCQYSTQLYYLDVSSNYITDFYSSSTSCLSLLSYLNVSSNRISYIDVMTFFYLYSLVTLDLSNNNLASLPTNMFATGNLENPILQNLQYLFLQNNKLTTLDPWYFYMKSIKGISLANNKIVNFTNQINLSAMAPGVSSTQSPSIDLSNNLIQSFDDTVLSIYSLCTRVLIKNFVQFMSETNLQGNPLNCRCSWSYSLVSNLANYIGLFTSSTLYKTGKCAYSTDGVVGQPVIGFSLKGCTSSSSPCSINGQIYSVEDQLGAPQYTLNVSSPKSSFYAGYICGIIVAFFGALCLFFLLLYLICPIEILSCLFVTFPCFFRWCPCKSGAKREKEHDLFISFNKANRKWVKSKLLPFIKDNYLVEDYVLHYNKLNRSDVFSGEIAKTMSKSSIILLVLSDNYLMHEWNNKDLREHVRYLVTSERTRLVCIQLYDVCDEEVEQYFRQQIQIPNLVTLEDDEMMFWMKLHYHLYSNDSKRVVMPMNYSAGPQETNGENEPASRKNSIDETKKEDIKTAKEEDKKEERDENRRYKIRDRTEKEQQSSKKAEVEDEGQSNKGFVNDDAFETNETAEREVKKKRKKSNRVDDNFDTSEQKFTS